MSSLIITARDKLVFPHYIYLVKEIVLLDIYKGKRMNCLIPRARIPRPHLESRIPLPTYLDTKAFYADERNTKGYKILMT